MSDLNHVTLIGRITWDPELKYTKNGTPIVCLNLACNKKRKMQDEIIDHVSFFTVILYGKIAETLAPYLTKGKCIGVDGELRQRRWETSGKPRSAVEIIADEIQLLTFSKAKNKKTQSPENCDDSLADLEGIL